MKQLKSISLRNFKFFYGEEANDSNTINLEGKNLLVYGENGSGKSSVYWAFYTILQSYLKNDNSEITKYFTAETPPKPSNLKNRYASNDTKSGIDLVFIDESENEITKTVSDTEINTKGGNNEIEKIHTISDFLNYKYISKFYDFRNSQNADLFDLFEKELLMFIDFGEEVYHFQSGINQGKFANKWWEYISSEYINLPKWTSNNKKVHFLKKETKNYINQFEDFKKKLSNYLLTISESANKYLKEKFHENLTFSIELEEDYTFNHDLVEKSNQGKLDSPKINLSVEFNSDKIDDNKKNISRPHTFLNEAKLTAIFLSLRLAMLKKRPKFENFTKLLIIDDLLISLDMSNREIVLDILLDEFNDYQTLFFTHDINLFNFVKNKLKQNKVESSWKIKEMYSHHCAEDKFEKPLIIDSDYSDEEKAKKYFDKKDYTTCSLYLRKSFEKVIREKLPIETIKTADDKFITLNNLWKKFIERANLLGSPVPKSTIDHFEQSKLLILNPQAHYSELSAPVYKYELDNAFTILDKIKQIHLTFKKVILMKDCQIKFTHPKEKYWCEYRLIQDFITENNKITTYPDCKTIKWEYNGQKNTIPSSGKQFTQDQVDKFSKNKLDSFQDQLKSDTVLNVDRETFLTNTLTVDGGYTLKELLKGVKFN
ncbi:AAA family ATPase [Aureibacter tunicatorum]|uniref:ABC-type dipeptide/oligopeptide/nickel transport system ATPase subunit n=1 Tax=Aureibacter tunicatorum TaxID=866807 RepID=A0AAE3XMZ6_9BACT|nr:AAA family ATPase [Aureibacter tunicatorum]MDR6239480.1 ABC-type dipeptide/oligopeptide/nickel transport system ATPase subunit [Aureibacter tunicatorum]BDD04598.1 hypothetical protein AUTU_20810 [Aureibacter tunicatorum]